MQREGEKKCKGEKECLIVHLSKESINLENKQKDL